MQHNSSSRDTTMCAHSHIFVGMFLAVRLMSHCWSALLLSLASSLDGSCCALLPVLSRAACHFRWLPGVHGMWSSQAHDATLCDVKSSTRCHPLWCEVKQMMPPSVMCTGNACPPLNFRDGVLCNPCLTFEPVSKSPSFPLSPPCMSWSTRLLCHRACHGQHNSCVTEGVTTPVSQVPSSTSSWNPWRTSLTVRQLCLLVVSVFGGRGAASL